MTIRILHFVSTFAVKTDTKWLLQVARHLDRGRFEMEVACFYGDSTMAAAFEAEVVPTHNLDAPGVMYPRAVRRAKRVIREGSFDLVHTHLLRADLLGAFAARQCGLPVISTAYAIGQYRRQKRRVLDGVLDRACRRLATHVLAVSEAVQRDCVEGLGWPPERVSVVHTGIEIPPPVPPERAKAVRTELGVADDAPLVVTVARLSYEKGLDTLIDAAAAVRQRLPAAGFAVVGDGPDREALQQQIATRRLDDAVRLVGFRRNVSDWLAAADVVAVPSYSEGMPNVVLEAMAAGRAIVATRVGGIPEAIRDGQTGRLVPPGDAGALAAAIVEAIDSPERRRAWGAAARREVEQRFTADRAVRGYEALYERVLAGRGMRGAPGP